MYSSAYNLNVADHVFLVGKGLLSAVTGYGLDSIQTGIAACSVSYTVNG
jgi:hypothetical protein